MTCKSVSDYRRVVIISSSSDEDEMECQQKRYKAKESLMMPRENNVRCARSVAKKSCPTALTLGTNKGGCRESSRLRFKKTAEEVNPMCEPPPRKKVASQSVSKLVELPDLRPAIATVTSEQKITADIKRKVATADAIKNKASIKADVPPRNQRLMEEMMIKVKERKIERARKKSIRLRVVPAIVDHQLNTNATTGVTKHSNPLLEFAGAVGETKSDSDEELYECSCCYNSVYFDYLVQCYEGHLFCCNCLQRYTHESVFGDGKATLQCMSEGCTAQFPRSQLLRALPSSLHEKYESRVAEEYLNLAALPNLVKCFYCGIGAELDANFQFFQCPNPVCCKIFCRFCQKDWDIHKGVTCDKVEEKDETQIRLKFEERMAEAKIRQCHRCKTKFTKEDGCNKITCRCGATLCYVCRASNINYNHFCQHVRSPQKGCKNCNQCFLWSNAEQDDKLAIAELKKEASQVRAEKGFEGNKEIGVPLSVGK